MSKMNPALRKPGNNEIYTPEWCAKDMINHFNPSGKILEPCKGGGVFTNLLPGADWCGINEGKDFFDYHHKVDWIISNPPYSLIRLFVLHSFGICDNIVYLIPTWKAFNAYGLVKETSKYGGIKEMRHYGTGSKLGFPMGNGISAIYWKRDYSGPIYTSFYEEI